MLLAIISATWCLILVQTLYKLAASELYRVNVRFRPNRQSAQNLPAIRVVVPMRNEAANIQACVGGLLAQAYPGALEVVVVNDGSTDGCDALVEQLQRSNNGPVQLHLIQAPPLPEGWSGKCNGCQAGADYPTGNQPQYLMFIDADVQPKPQLVHAAVLYAEQHDIRMLSLIPRQRLETIGERLVLMGIFLMAADAMDFKRIHNPRDKNYAVADGQCMLFYHPAYQAMGGHAAVAHHIMEDMAFAENFKRAGHHLRFDWCVSLMTCRMYEGFAKAYNGMSNNLLRIVGGHVLTARLLSVKYLLLALGFFALPVAAWLLRSAPSTAPDVWNTWALWLSVSGPFLLLVVFVGACVFYNISPLYAPLTAISFLLQPRILHNSIRRSKTGRFLWRGRTLNASA